MNPKLEKVSWIAGIVSAVVAVYVILPGMPLKDKVPHSSPRLETTVDDKKQQKIAIEPLHGEIESISDIRTPPPCQENKHLQEAIKTAETIYSTVQRDKIYTSLVFDALCGGKYELALDITKKIYTTTIRDDSYYRSVEFFVLRSDVDYANRFARMIYTTTIRDRAKQVIIVGMKGGESQQGAAPDRQEKAPASR